jgi:hypothetical protein
MKDGVNIGGVFIEFNDDEPLPRQRKTTEEVRPKIERRMARIDALTPEQRLVVHEHGWNIVSTFMEHGVTSPRSMRSLINAVVANCVDRKDRLDD